MMRGNGPTGRPSSSLVFASGYAEVGFWPLRRVTSKRTLFCKLRGISEQSFDHDRRVSSAWPSLNAGLDETGIAIGRDSTNPHGPDGNLHSAGRFALQG